ncbi:hypothetical protein [Thalassolituus hydrocarboniclasticus]|uniref:Uncharacterized protein n=1 Tax=Thalassolituus hydrocarboniclasticus TaxID=2742796 RepID=A0ABY6AE66_9GAMM|nr:hypothetical protein [Thalassolituus hydrocarboniclasticus]UXD88754.1 hypothetical protein HUF19_15505 [Thalassolituus hydrocarboniclasticus]
MKYVKIELTQGNINNDHLYLSSVIEFFPKSSIGGSNIESQAETLLEVHSGIEKPVLTDIAGDKKIFRKRSWVGEFFKVHELKAGDYVVIEHTDSNRYHVYPART